MTHRRRIKTRVSSNLHEVWYGYRRSASYAKTQSNGGSIATANIC